MSSRRLGIQASPINPRSRMPKYLQVQASLIRQIQRNGLIEGAQLPAEQDLVHRFGVSKMTVRHAIADLVKEGFLRRDHGRGTFVTRPRALRRLWTVLSFTEEMLSRGLEVQNQLLDARRMTPPERVRSALRLRKGQQVLRVRRLRLVHGHPIAYNVSHIPLNRCPGLDADDLEAESLYTLIQRRYGFRFTRCDRSYRAGTPSPAEARLLGVTVQSPILLVEGTTFVDEGTPIDYCHEVYSE